ncbi:MAG: hypothetical protein HDQ88_02145 [Clostridia bacterium]|nr:hypothetical protein [Clostridia bacterium]
MRILKGVLSAVVSLLIVFLPINAVVANADALPRYAYVGEGVKAYLYKDKNLTKALFAIPETYCVEILGQEGDCYKCRYAKDEGLYRPIEGYCEKSALTLIDEPLENEYLNYTLTVTLYAKPDDSQFPLLELEIDSAYYGEGEVIGTPHSYVYCYGTFGYVTERVTSYPKNDIPQTTSAPAGEAQNSANATLITAIVITVVAGGAVTVLYFMGKRPKIPPKPEG